MKIKINMQHLYTIAIASAITFLSLFGAYNYMPLPVDTVGEQMLGTAITTISGSDKMKDFPTTYNANLAALNAGKIEISTTSLPLITTLGGLTTAGSLATIGTIGTGVWNGTAITVGYGGTGTTSPTAKQVMIGNGASGFKVLGFGTSGQFLTSAGNAADPSWTTSSINEAGDYTWTGEHIFSATSTFNGFTTMNDLMISSSTVNYSTASSSIASVGYVNSLVSTYASGATTRTGEDGSGNVVIAHGMGAVPERVSMFCYGDGPDRGSIGTWDGTSYAFAAGGSVNSDNASIGTDKIAYIFDGASASFSAAVSVDGTNLTIAWTEVSSAGDVFCLWETFID